STPATLDALLSASSELTQNANLRPEFAIPGDNASAAPQGVASHPPDDVVAVDLPCIRCGYNLRTLMVKARCPECHTPVRDSFDPDRLIFAERRWLVWTRHGLTL